MNLAFDRSGTGPPLVLIHGLGSSRRVWDAPLSLIESEREVIAVDLPGFGESPEMPSRPTPSALADSVEGLIADLGLARPAVGGNSLGGLISLELARRGSVTSATALSPAGFWSKGEARFASTSLRIARAGASALEPVLPSLASNRMARTLLAGQLVAHPGSVPPEDLELAIGGLIHSPGFERTRDALFAQTWAHRGPLAAPATVAWAERDRLLIPRQARRAEAWIPGIRSITLRSCGHVPCWDDPPLVARTLIEGSAR